MTVKLLGKLGNKMHCFSATFIRYVTFIDKLGTDLSFTNTKPNHLKPAVTPM